jgi:hypothetical protein
VNCAKVREVDNRIAVGMAAAEVVRLDFSLTEKDRGRVVEGDARCAGLVVPDNIVPGVPMRDHFGVAHEVGVATSVVPVVMRVKHVPNRLVGDAPDLFGNEVKAVGKLVVDDDDSVTSDPNRDVAPGLPPVESGNHVESIRYLTDLEARFLLRRERRSLRLSSCHDYYRTA